MPTGPDFARIEYTDIDVGTTFSRRMALLDLLLQVADGNDESLRLVYERFKELEISS